MYYLISGSHSVPVSPNKSEMTVVQQGAPATSSDLATPASSDPSSLTPPHHTSVTALSHKPSWFASWTRTKGELVPDSGVEKTRRLTPVPTSGTESSSSIGDVHPQITVSSVSHQSPIPSITGDPQLVSTQTPALTQDIPTKPRFSEPSSSPPAAHSKPGSMSTPSPLDEDVPKPSPSKLPPATPSTVLQSSDASDSISTPTNRFTLSIPLLGRGKVPIEKTVAAAQCDDIRTMSLPADQPPPSKQPLTTQGLLRSSNTITAMSYCIAIESIPLAAERPSAPVAETTEVNITADTLVQPGEMTDKGAASDIQVTSLQSSTWWSYLGWSSTQPPSAQRFESHVQTDSIPTNSSAVPDAPPLPVGEMAAQPILDSETVVPQKSEDGSEDQIASQKIPFGGTSEPQGVAWYTPWLWHQGLSTPVTSTGSHSDIQVTGEGGNVPSELAKDDEVIKQAATSVSSSPEPQAPGTMNANPISSTITDNRSGWISFFSARAVTMKSIANESHNEEMEVMDLDEDEAPATAGSPSLAPSSTPLSKDVLTKPSSPIQAGVSPVPPSLSPTARKKVEDKPNPAGNSSDALRRGAAKRPPSPTPSKKSGLKTPIFPPPPNLVLPTWEDTFHTQPRAHVPAQPSSALSKTFQYVSDVLFARDEPAANKKGKARERPLGPYEKALPRSWDVIGGQEQRDVLQGCQRAVVIGVHGWFPGAYLLPRAVTGHTHTPPLKVPLCGLSLERLVCTSCRLSQY